MELSRMPALQLCPFSAEMEQGLSEVVELVRWFEMDDAAQADFLARRGEEVRIVVTGGHIGCPADLMRALPALKLVAINGVGFDKVPLDLARERGVAVTTTPGVLTDDVADLAVGLVIALKRRIPAGDRHVRAGEWPRGELPLARKISGSRFGILGLGAIGSAIAARLRAFGEVGYSSPIAQDADYARFPDAKVLAEWCDVLIVACAATPATAGLVDGDVLAALGPDGCLVNVARGSIVDEGALIAALDAGTIAGAALDVFADEPRVPDALRNSPRTVLTPHVASATVETRAAMAATVIANVRAVAAGEPPVTPLPMESRP